jgi:hypothetical protein
MTSKAHSRIMERFIHTMIDHGTESQEVADFLQEFANDHELTTNFRKALELKRRAQSRPHGKDSMLSELKLLKKGIDLAHKREKTPSYAMELQAMAQTADTLIRMREMELAERKARTV